jgi:hypothetical protein
MEILTVWAPVFVAGIGVGVLITSVLPRLWHGKKQRTELVAARARVLAGIKQNHEQEILREIFRATDALRGELNKSLRAVLDSIIRLLEEVRDDVPARNKRGYCEEHR